MARRQLTKDQAETIHKDLFPGTNYIVRLIKRMQETGFLANDEIHSYPHTQRKVVQVHVGSKVISAREADVALESEFRT